MHYFSNFLQTISAVLIALVLFQSATLIIGGHIAKEFLQGFYQTFPHWWSRMLIVIIPLSGIGNIFAVLAYQQPVVAGISFLVIGLWSPIIMASIIGNNEFDGGNLALMISISTLGIWLGLRMSGTS